MSSVDLGTARAQAHAYAASPADALRMFAEAPFVRFSSVRADGSPIVRAFNTVVVDGRLCFHGADRGEKLDFADQRAVACVERVVADVPSYWVHPELACPASTYYESAHAHGVVRRIEDAGAKARVLSLLMERFQPEGGYAPIQADDPRYAPVIEQLLVAELVPDRLSARRKLGQNRSEKQVLGVLEGLFRRGAPGDMRAVRLVREAHPARPTPAFLRALEGTVLCVSPDERDARAVAHLLRGQYWTHGFSDDEHVRAHLASSAWVVARTEPSGEVVASARAVSDGARFAWVLDVVVREDLRSAGLGGRLMALLLEHPALRNAARVGLATRDAQAFYERLGFVRPHTESEPMVRKRAPG